MRPAAFLLLLVLATAVAFGGYVYAETSNCLPEKQLLKLENKFFGHGFERDALEQRVSRLEELMYGERLSGDLSERIGKLALLLPADEEKKPEAKSPDTRSIKEGQVERNTAVRGIGPSPDLQAQYPEAKSLNHEESRQLKKYPHVDDLELLIVGNKFAEQPLNARVTALETKAFGSPTDLYDMASRIDALDNYVEKKLHKNPYPERVVNQTAQGETSGPNVSAIQSEGRYIASEPGDAKTAKKSIVNKHTLANAASTALAVGLGTLGPKLPLQFAGVRFAQKPQQVLEDAAEADFDASPAGQISAASAAQSAQTGPGKDPPAANARLIDKVSWCESRIYGRNFPMLHLTERLRQLSIELRCNEGKSDLELMDDVGTLVRAVQLRQKTQPISANQDNSTK